MSLDMVNRKYCLFLSTNNNTSYEKTKQKILIKKIHSYSTFVYSPVTLSKTTVSSTDTITATVKVTNNSTRDGTEVVQMYIQDVIASVAVPNIQLRGFSKVPIAAGATETVNIPLNITDVGLWNVNMEYVVEPGDFVVWIGSSSADFRGSATFTVE